MIRLLLFEIFIFSSPFWLYALYILISGKRQAGMSIWKNAPLLNLGLVGILLVGAGILAYGLYWA